MNTDAKFVTCHCQSCSGEIEFERELFDPENPALVECPHCSSQVRLYIPKTDNAQTAQETLSSTPETQEKVKRGKRISLTSAQRETAAGKELLVLLCEITRDGLISEEGVKKLNAWLEGNNKSNYILHMVIVTKNLPRITFTLFSKPWMLIHPLGIKTRPNISFRHCNKIFPNF